MDTTFSINENYIDLLKDCLAILADAGTILFSTNSTTFKLDKTQFDTALQITEITEKTTSEDFRNSRSHRCWEIIK